MIFYLKRIVCRSTYTVRRTQTEICKYRNVLTCVSIWCNPLLALQLGLLDLIRGERESARERESMCW